MSAAAETLVRILKRVIVSPPVYPRFLEIAELARSLCHSELLVTTRNVGAAKQMMILEGG